MPMQETRQESKTVPLHQPAAPAGPAQTANTPRSQPGAERPQPFSAYRRYPHHQL